MTLTELVMELEKLSFSDMKLRERLRTEYSIKWIEGSFNLDAEYTHEGETIREKDVRLIFEDEFPDSLSISANTMAKNQLEVCRYLYSIRGKYSMTDFQLLKKTNSMLCANLTLPEQAGSVRKISPMLPEFGKTIPCHTQYIEEEMTECMKEFRRNYMLMKPVFRACAIHCELLRIYPFAKYNEATARSILNYELISEGYLPFSFDVKAEEYRECVMAYLKKKDMKPFLNMVEEGEKRQYLAVLNELLKK